MAASRTDNPVMSSPKVLFGFHAVGVYASRPPPRSVLEVYFEPTRRDARMRQFLDAAREANVRVVEADGMRLAKLAGSHGHQGVAARVESLARRPIRWTTCSTESPGRLAAGAGRRDRSAQSGRVSASGRRCGCACRDCAQGPCCGVSTPRWPRSPAVRLRPCRISWSPIWRARWAN
jgi:hypothetical protein